MVTSNIIEAVVSINRLSACLNADELQPNARQLIQSKPKLGLGEEVLSIKAGEFSWSKESVSPTLEGIDLTVKKGELVGVLGRVGAGKVRLYVMAFFGDHSQSRADEPVLGHRRRNAPRRW